MDLCVICHKPTSKNNGAITSKETLNRFFPLLGRYLHETPFEKNDYDKKELIIFQRVINARVISCGVCSKLVKSFCYLYHKMKSIELMLNWKVETLKNLMARGHQGTFNMTEFRKSVERLGFEDIQATDIIKSRNGLISKCKRRLAATVPRVKLRRKVCNRKKPPPKAEERERPHDGICLEIRPNYRISHADSNAPLAWL